ncbi:hypothetical protein [Streptomyces sp. NPDC057302]|uniref:hypothetical protein n=1 Tax=Streptomyces sp. NPDC057302 TaxID=3346094 RepID=UPI00362ECAA1
MRSKFAALAFTTAAATTMTLIGPAEAAEAASASSCRSVALGTFKGGSVCFYHRTDTLKVFYSNSSQKGWKLKGSGHTTSGRKIKCVNSKRDSIKTCDYNLSERSHLTYRLTASRSGSNTIETSWLTVSVRTGKRINS